MWVFFLCIYFIYRSTKTCIAISSNMYLSQTKNQPINQAFRISSERPQTEIPPSSLHPKYHTSEVNFHSRGPNTSPRLAIQYPSTSQIAHPRNKCFTTMRVYKRVTLRFPLRQRRRSQQRLTDESHTHREKDGSHARSESRTTARETIKGSRPMDRLRVLVLIHHYI